MITVVDPPQLDLRPAVRAALRRPTGESGLPAPDPNGMQPVVVTGGVSNNAGGPVVVAVDADAYPGVLLRYGWELSGHLGVPLRVVYVWTDCRFPDCAHHRVCHRDLADAERLLAALLDEHLPAEAAGRIEREVLHGADPGEALRAISAVAALLVIGSSSDQPVPARSALGSTARSLVGHTSCPLVLVPYEVARVLPARW